LNAAAANIFSTGSDALANRWRSHYRGARIHSIHAAISGVKLKDMLKLHRVPLAQRVRTPLAVTLLVAGLLGLACAPAAGAALALKPLPERRPVCIRGICFDSEIAVTADERSRGLMYRDTLGKDRGMLFVFPEEGLHRFWMKNTRIELDIIFIGADLRVVSISKRAQPCREDPCDRYGPTGNAAYALEIAGGLADVHGFAAGDLVEFREVPRSR
jgi:uncharacterized protein